MLSLLRHRAVAAVARETSSKWSRSVAVPPCGGPLLSESVAAAPTRSLLHTASVDRHQSVPRRLSPVTLASVPPAAIQPVASKDDSREFMAIFPDLVRDLTEAGRHVDIPEVTKWLSKVLQYNATGGKRNRAMAVVYSYRLLAEKGDLTPENQRLTMILGWCVEILQAFFLVTDDLMDESVTRRGKPCWYKVNDIGLAAFNDGILLESSVFQLLRTHFRNKDCYMDLVELFHDVIYKTSMGQALDLQTSHKGKPDLSVFTMARYQAIIKYKTAYYSFYLPVALAMVMAGIKDNEVHRQARTILLQMGEFFQVQDDYLDCYGDPSVTGKIGTDIQEGKCTWLAVVALQRANKEQREIMEKFYGSPDPADIQRIKDLYEELNVPLTYGTFEEESYNRIRTLIQQVSRGLPVELFFKFLDQIHKRQN
ncbi:Farnesyl pyrophosphate synthase [Frankliniella fusca]|uniref:Farnesyl pyrophosphate synthase n=1 Tax=Frankliniella fusca TaxID=407009 RepID=A0AAE1HUU3_9NEOP|nr:Farnesyl pyrophosphate synthase [Frankliniella fusca]